MRHPNVLDISKTALVIVDLQEAFRKVALDFDLVSGRVAKLAQGAALLGIPILITEQNPDRLGKTVAEILNVLPSAKDALGKLAFSACGAAGFMPQLKATGAKQVLVCGLETHICVNQTVHDLLADGFQVHLLIDCLCSRTAENRQIGISKMLQSGAIPCNVEMALFELMVDAQHEQFKAIQKLVK